MTPRWYISGVRKDYIRDLWPLVWPILERAVNRAPAEIRITREQAMEKCIDEEAQLWVIWDGHAGEYAAVAVTVISTDPRETHADLEIPFVAGRNMHNWLVPLWTTLRLFGLQHECVDAIGYGRKGWERLLGFHYVGEERGIRVMKRPLALDD